MGEHGQSSWHTHSLPLGLPGSVTCADVAAEADAQLRIAAVTDDNQRAVHAMHISGDPTLGEVSIHGHDNFCMGQSVMQAPLANSTWTRHDVARGLSNTPKPHSYSFLCC